jgi:hypothetical protein
VITDCIDTKVLRSWWRSIDMNRIVFNVKFEDGLSILVLRNKATFITKKVGFKTDEF